MDFKGTNAQNLRACLAWLGASHREIATELGCSSTYLRDVLAGAKIPDSDMQSRIVKLSTRWPHGIIYVEDWPQPCPVERRGGKR